MFVCSEMCVSYLLNLYDYIILMSNIMTSPDLLTDEDLAFDQNQDLK